MQLDDTEQPPSWNICLGKALSFIPNCMWNPVFTNYSKDSWEQFNNNRKTQKANQLSVVYTWFLFSKGSSCSEQIATNIFPLIPCQTTSCQCHHLQPSNNDVPSSLVYFCKTRSFIQKNKYRWPIRIVCFVLILKKRLGKKKKALLSVTMIIWSLPGSAWKDMRLSDLANKCHSHNFSRN